MAEVERESFVSLAIAAIFDRLTEKLQVNLEDDDSSKAGIIKVGYLQDDPLIKKINVLIREGGTDWPDELDEKHFGVDAAHEIGGFGGSFWRRRLIIELTIFFENEKDFKSTGKRVHSVLSRTINALMTMPSGDFPADDFGEQAYSKQVVKQAANPGGGEGDFNYRCMIWHEILTEIEYFDL